LQALSLQEGASLQTAAAAATNWRQKTDDSDEPALLYWLRVAHYVLTFTMNHITDRCTSQWMCGCMELLQDSCPRIHLPASSLYMAVSTLVSRKLGP
jgi:hypothetical protein